MARFYQPKKKTSLSTKHQSIEISRLDHQGAGIGYRNKKPVFIPGALPGENVVFQLVESKSKFERGRLIKVLQSSDERVEPFCPHYSECGGCDLQHLDRSAQLASKQNTLKELVAKFSGQSLSLDEPIFSHDKAYRRRARLSIRFDKSQQKLAIGFRKKQSQDIINIDHCPVLVDEINQLLPELRQTLTQSSRANELGHAELVFADSGLIIVIRHMKKLSDQDRQSLIELSQRFSATLYLMPSAEKLERVVGDAPYYEETGYRTAFEPNHFIQVNRDVNEAMVQQALQWLNVEENERVLDLFCGVGNFSLPMATKAREVVGIEGIDDMVSQAKINAEKNQITNARFYQANLEEDMTLSEWGKEKFDKILLDPARAGAKGIIEQCRNLGAKQVVYVSCNPATLARDCQRLIEQGYRLERLGMLDMFPHTSHLESMALFVRV